MADVVTRLQELLEPVVTGLGYELYGLEYLGQGKYSVLRIYIDQESGITVDDCSKVSHQVSGVLDVEDPISGQYTLEVSSPGMDRPLLKAEHYGRYTGQQVKVKLDKPINGQSRFSGVLRGLKDGSVVVEVDGELIEFTVDMVNKARLVPEF